jgi:hypothetical protein
MANVGTKPVPQGCSEKRRLTRGDYSTDESLQAQLKKAHELKVPFMQELKKHVAKQGC